MRAQLMTLLMVLAFAHAAAQAQMENAGPAKSVLAEVQGNFRKSGSLNAYLQSLKSAMSLEDFKFIGKKISPADVARVFPEIKLQGEDSMRLQVRRTSVVLKVLSAADKRFMINGKELDLADATAAERWDKIWAIMPRSSASTGVWRFILPAAIAANVKPPADADSVLIGLVGSLTLLVADIINSDTCKQLPANAHECEQDLNSFDNAADASADTKLQKCPSLVDMMKSLNRLLRELTRTCGKPATARLSKCVTALEEKRKSLSCPGEGVAPSTPAGK